MVEDAGEEFSEALLPLLEISDEEQKVDLAKEVLPFIAKVFASHGRKLDTETVSKALKPVFKEKAMIKTIFEEKYDIGYSEGKAEQGKITLLKILQARFHKVPKDVEKLIRSMTDSVALDSWAVHAATCQSMDEFAKAIR